jgi:transposase
VREDGYTGAKTALYALVAELRPKDSRPMVRFEGVAGEFSQHDFGQVDVVYVDGTKKRVHFFASRLKWSRWVEVSVVPDECVETLVRTLVVHYECMGGVPLASVFDRPKTVAILWGADGVVTQWNQTFLQAIGALGVAPEQCWPYSPEQKGAVENLVKWAKGSFFKCRKFLDDDDLERQLRAWLHEVNTTRPSRATNEIPALRMEREERARLRPVKVPSAQLVLRFPVQVGPTAYVTHDGCRDSMPPQAIGATGTLFLGQTSLKNTAGRWSALHPRLFFAALEK